MRFSRCLAFRTASGSRAGASREAGVCKLRVLRGEAIASANIGTDEIDEIFRQVGGDTLA